MQVSQSQTSYSPYSFIRQLFETIQLFYFRFLHLFIKLEEVPPKITVEIDPIAEYITKKKDWFIQKYKPTFNEKLNENIDDFFYNKTDLFKILKDETNLIEKIWKTHILYEPTPRGNVIMFYDVYKYGFTYYSDQTIPYSILNAVAMKYCIIFCCRDFFMDEETTLEAENFYFPKENLDSNLDVYKKNDYHFLSPLIKIYFEEEKKEEPTEKKKIDAKELIKNAPMAKLKNYKMTTVKNANNTTSSAPQVLFKNKFIYLGKTMNYSILQKQKQVKTQIKSCKSNEFDNLFSETTTDTSSSNYINNYINSNSDTKINKLSWKDYKNNLCQ